MEWNELDKQIKLKKLNDIEKTIEECKKMIISTEGYDGRIKDWSKRLEYFEKRKQKLLNKF